MPSRYRRQLADTAILASGATAIAISPSNRRAAVGFACSVALGSIAMYATITMFPTAPTFATQLPRTARPQAAAPSCDVPSCVPGCQVLVSAAHRIPRVREWSGSESGAGRTRVR
ncbi:hypothetical protein [Rhodococcus sp. T7]|uniref:hypothetical protein n=1 Tax=Rhodococcus sp. T7 TaxID=627444 RepID=UPI00135BFF9D|nr:hypothetical protein [Rhodococcus sp. T7]